MQRRLIAVLMACVLVAPVRDACSQEFSRSALHATAGVQPASAAVVNGVSSPGVLPNASASNASRFVSTLVPSAAPASRHALATMEGPLSKAPWYAPLASLAVPGSGQAILKQQRGMAYLVVEGYLIVQAISANQSSIKGRNSYRRIAADVARASFGGTRPNGRWAYYESMESFLESGAFDMTPGGSIDPETDVSTFNGSQWRLARETYWRDPQTAPEVSSAEYQRALEFYSARAVRDDFRWSWRDAQLQQDVYRQAIRSANHSYQRTLNLMGAVAANHLLSMIDAFVTVRVRRVGALGESSIQTEVGSDPLSAGGFRSSLRIPLPQRSVR